MTDASSVPDPGPLSRAYLDGSSGVFVPVAAVSLTGDAGAAILLGQILWWFTRAHHPTTRNRGGHTWLVKPHASWEGECGLKPHQARRSLARLQALGLVEAHTWKHDGTPQTHVRVCWEALEDRLEIAHPESTDAASGLDNADESLDLSDAASPPLSETEETTDLTPSRGGTLAHRSPTFADCWKVYPRKLARLKAEKAWKARIRSGVDPQQLYDATVHYARHRNGQDGSYTMHAATFYGPDDRWADFLDPTTAEPPPARRTAKQEADARLLAEVARVNGHRQEISA